ncbi:MAG: hypothetical protein IJS66_04230 [Bacteroidales bacterium]|nr:hypothetical protein [Bacteroidales bacterium]
MNKIDFTDDAGKIVRSVQLPASWDEMTPEQVRFVFRRYDDYANGTISALRLNVEILFKFLNKNFRAPHGSIAASQEALENIYRLCESCLDFLFAKPKDEVGVMSLTFNSVRNPLPAVRSGVARPLLTGPDSALVNLTFGEFRHASAALGEFFATGEMEALDRCIACLYRRRSARPNLAGRFVQPMQNAAQERAVRDAAAMAPWQKTLIMMWFSACINFLQTAKIRLNGEEVDLALLYGGGAGTGPAVTLNDLALQIARDGSIGNADRVDEEPLYNILGVMWSNYKENKRNEKASKNHKS